MSKQPSAKPSDFGLPLHSATAIPIMPQIRLRMIKAKLDQMFILHLCWTFAGGLSLLIVTPAGTGYKNKESGEGGVP
jgi:hypothetical protein